MNEDPIGNFHNQITDLNSIDKFRYENIFKVYQTSNSNHYFYNILTKVHIPEDLDPSVYYEILINDRRPWTIISFGEYGTMNLWWLIVLANQIDNPILFPPSGSKLKIIKKEYISQILNSISTQLNR